MALTNFQKNALSTFWGGALDGVSLTDVNSGLTQADDINLQNAQILSAYEELLSVTESLITSDYYTAAQKLAFERAIYQIYNLYPSGLTAPTFPDPDA